MVLFVNPLTPIVKPWVIQSFLIFDSMDRTLKCDHSLESCSAVLYCLYPVCNFGKFINFGIDTVRSERVNSDNEISLCNTSIPSFNDRGGEN